MIGFVHDQRYAYTTRVQREGHPPARISGKAHATIESLGTEQHAATRLRVIERGEWTRGPTLGVAVTNAWHADQHEPDLIAIHHARGRSLDGRDSAFLLNLIPDAQGWRAQSAHACAEDSYALIARQHPQGIIELEWTVLGPRKNDRLITTYTPNTPTIAAAPRP